MKQHGAEVYVVAGVTQLVDQLKWESVYLADEAELVRDNDKGDSVFFEELHRRPGGGASGRGDDELPDAKLGRPGPDQPEGLSRVLRRNRFEIRDLGFHPLS